MNCYPAYICENGHVIDASSEYCSDKFCTLCGAPVISACPHCGEFIHGFEYGFSGYYRPPSYCHNCGNPMPWIEHAAHATAELLAEDENITADEANRLMDVFPDIIVETPKTQLAVVRLKKALKTLGSFSGEALKQFILDFACDAIRNQLGL